MDKGLTYLIANSEILTNDEKDTYSIHETIQNEIIQNNENEIKVLKLTR